MVAPIEEADYKLEQWGGFLSKGKCHHYGSFGQGNEKDSRDNNEGWQRVVGELSMEKTFQSVNSDSIHLFPEMIISDSCMARFERYISFEMGTKPPKSGFQMGTRCSYQASHTVPGGNGAADYLCPTVPGVSSSNHNCLGHTSSWMSFKTN
ncbi:hypothetical protein OIU84_012122 [Salix udensis]|uniref:Uncharacterized protein n=1 Tax=Salix udensis TaxID=889485 RepID=A0AAD6JGT7_9ROSI|nr:hypothetical protein OIU84_012122 [Salix udensis]